MQDAGETGINGVTVELLDGGGTVIATTATAGDGIYTFTNLPGGHLHGPGRRPRPCRPALAPTYDLDGIGTAHTAVAALAGGQNRTDVDFGYRGTGSLGDRVWTTPTATACRTPARPGINGVTVELLNGTAW